MVTNFVPKRELGLNYIFTFGKYEGKTLEYVFHENIGYVLWCADTIEWFRLESSLYERVLYKDAEENYYPFDDYDTYEGSDDYGSPRY